MNAISMGLASAVPLMLSIQTSVVLNSLANGIARPGETLGVGLSNGIAIDAYAWGSTPGGAEYGSGATLLVPVEADGTTLYVTLTAEGQEFEITVEVSSDLTGSATVPEITGVPTITGLAETGQTLIATAAPSSGTAPITTGWQWLRDGAMIPDATEPTQTLTATDAGTAISVQQIDSNAQGNDTATSAALTIAPVTGSVALITGLLVTDQNTSGDVDLAYSIDNDSDVTGVVTGSATPPFAAQVLAGQDHTGAVAASSFTDTWTVSGSDTLPDITSGLGPDVYYLHVLPSGGGDAAVASSNGFQMETSAPLVTTAQTSSSGLEIEVTFSENLAGVTNIADWTVTVDGVVQTLSDASFVGPQITLVLPALVGSGQILLLSYSGTTLSDTVANPVASFAAWPVTNAVTGTFVENSVTVPQGSYLTAADPMPSNSRAILFFASLTQEAGLNSRVALASWRGTLGGIYADYTTGNGACGLRLRLQDGTASIIENVEPVSLGSRYHLLVSGWIDAANTMNVRAWILDTTSGSWTEVINTTDISAPGATLELGPNLLRLFTRSDSTNHNFGGVVHRIALWSGAASAPIADITDPAQRDLFADAAGITDPALSRVTLGQPLVDFSGSAADYNAGTHSGSLGPFIPSGTFT